MSTPTKSGKSSFHERSVWKLRSLKAPFLKDPAAFAERGVQSTPARTTGSTPENDKGATLVARYWHKGEIKTRIWYADDIFTAIRRAADAADRVSAAQQGRLKTWNPKIDAHIKAHYRSIGPSQIARDLTGHYKRKFTKNMVISRYHRIKNV